MPVLPGMQNTTVTVQQMVNELKANPEFYNILGGAAGYSTFPALTIANEVMSRILAENMPWKWNRTLFPPFLTVSLQQDYVSNITDIGWLENGWLCDINNSTSNSNGAPKPLRGLETVRDMVWTSTQAVPFNVSFIPNQQASFGLWQANTPYSCGYGVAQLPRSPLQQFIDVNGNILFIDSTQLGINIESPGYTGTTIPLPTPNPYGTSGATQPAAPPNATPGSQVVDNTVTWTVADPNGLAIRLSPLPALNGLEWLVFLQYQIAPPYIPTLQTSLNPIPFQYLYLFRAGFRSQLKIYNNSKDAAQSYAEWEETLVRAVRGADRQQEDFAMYPSQSIMQGGFDGYGTTWAGIGAANPYGSALFGTGYGT